MKITRTGLKQRTDETRNGLWRMKASKDQNNNRYADSYRDEFVRRPIGLLITS